MARVIKFRAWDGEEMLKDVCTDTDDFTDMLNETFAMWANPKFEEDLELMQFTGLLDKNGKEIYEGDVVEFDKREWYRSCVLSLAEIDAKPSYYELVEFDYEYLAIRRTDFNQYCTVVGNIYQNGDLLK